MKVHFHDNKPAAPGEKHGPDGPTHCGSVSVDYEYQVEMWVDEVEKDQPLIFKVRCPDLLREWHRKDGKMIEVTFAEPMKQTKRLEIRLPNVDFGGGSSVLTTEAVVDQLKITVSRGSHCENPRFSERLEDVYVNLKPLYGNWSSNVEIHARSDHPAYEAIEKACERDAISAAFAAIGSLDQEQQILVFSTLMKNTYVQGYNKGIEDTQQTLREALGIKP